MIVEIFKAVKETLSGEKGINISSTKNTPIINQCFCVLIFFYHVF